ncbi:MAG TPA: hypothetical protein VMB71_11900 [Acetobacteraceae bacterium]|nr:hypothetical protein [Acetobacteraceae bacterium]
MRRSLYPIVLAGTAAVWSPQAAAVPLFARQTGQQCAACHNGFPELTPYGRLFKLNGYTFGGGQSKIPPISFMTVASFTHTQAAQPGGAAPHFGENDNPAIDFLSMFYGGVLLPHVGMFGQITYDNIGKALSWDNTDLRYSNTIRLGGHETILGVSVNNNPTAEDVWNSTPAWGYPWLSSGLAPSPAAATLIEGGLAQQVVGVTPYVFWDRLIYAEVGAYRTLGTRLLDEVGANPGPPNPINGVAPYWRLAVEPSWGANSWEIGTFGIRAAIVPGGVEGFGTDHITDVGLDTQYQYLGATNSFSVQGSLIAESDHFDASMPLGNTSNRDDHLRSIHLKASYYYDQTFGGTLAWFNVNGSHDAALWGPSSITNSPNSNGFIGELDYMPFNHGGPAFWPWLNVKFGAQYTYYTRFNGGTNNYDGLGDNASGANTFYLFAWLAF